VAHYQTWESYTEQQARDVIQQQQALVPGVPGQWFTFAVELKAAGVLIGHVALKVEDHQQAEIGFAFSRAHQTQGVSV
jgi:RimJ/RimL family protein N-acetyltransferase